MNLHSTHVKCEPKYHQYVTDGDREVVEAKKLPISVRVSTQVSQTNAVAHAEVLLPASLSKTVQSDSPQPTSPCLPLLQHLVKVFWKQPHDMRV